MVHQVSVNSTLRLNDRGAKKRPTIDWWAYSALKHHLCDDGALTYGQVASEAILFDISADYEVDGDRLSAIEEQVLDDLDAHLGIDTRRELASLGNRYELEVEGRLAKQVRERDDVDESPYSRKSQVSMYFIDCNLPEGRLGGKIEASLTRLLASPWQSRTHRLTDLQSLLTAVTRGWDAVDRDSRFLNWVRTADTSMYELGELAEAVSTAVDDEPDALSSESKSTAVTATDGGSSGDWWEAEDVTLADLRERDATGITQGDTRPRVLERAIQNTGEPISEEDLPELVRDIYGTTSPQTVKRYVDFIDLSESADDDADPIPIRDIIEEQLDEARSEATDLDRTSGHYPVNDGDVAGRGLTQSLDSVLEADIVYSQSDAMSAVRRVESVLMGEDYSSMLVDSEWVDVISDRAQSALTSARARVVTEY